MNLDDLFNEIYNKTYNIIFRYILSKCGNLSDVDDIIQDVYTDYYFILEKKSKKILNHEAYLMQITKNKIYKYYNSKSKKPEMSSNEDYILEIPDNLNLEEASLERFVNEDIWNETKKLNITTQKILILYFREDYKIIDIAKCMEMNESSVKTKLYRGIKELKENLGRVYE